MLRDESITFCHTDRLRFDWELKYRLKWSCEGKLKYRLGCEEEAVCGSVLLLQRQTQHKWTNWCRAVVRLCLIVTHTPCLLPSDRNIRGTEQKKRKDHIRKKSTAHMQQSENKKQFD